MVCNDEGYAPNGFSEGTSETVNLIKLSDVKPNSAGFVSILVELATEGALHKFCKFL